MPTLRLWGQINILSFRKQVELIDRCAREQGFNTAVVDIGTKVSPFRNHIEKQILFIVAMPHLLLWAFKMGWKAYADMTLVYATCEGKPKVNQHIINLIKDLRFIGVSRFAADRLADVGCRVIGWVPHALDPLEVEKVENETIDKGDGFTVGYVGSPIPRKGLGLLNEAAKIVYEKGYKDIKFKIWTQRWGDCLLPSGPNISIIENFGKAEHIDVMRFYRSLDLYVQPSLAEGFGIPIIEAMSVGVPVVSSNAGPMGELNHQERGYLVKATNLRLEDHGLGQDFYCYYYNPKDMASRIIEAYENPSARAMKAERAREFAKGFYYNNVYPQLIRMI